MAKLLVVDDSVETARILSRLLTRLGHQVGVAHSGEAALSSLSNDQPDLIILDLMMPGIDGAEVLRRVREDPQTRAVPVTLFSAVSDPQVRDHLLAKGAQDFWLKGSFDFGQLRDRVNRLLDVGAV